MLFNYLKIALRNLNKQRSLSGINILGWGWVFSFLALGFYISTEKTTTGATGGCSGCYNTYMKAEAWRRWQPLPVQVGTHGCRAVSGSGASYRSALGRSDSRQRPCQPALRTHFSHELLAFLKSLIFPCWKEALPPFSSTNAFPLPENLAENILAASKQPGRS